jgi:hypothetical protein
VDFQILSRNGQAPFAYERGWKDVVYVGETETVEVVARFGPNRGKYMMHCHNVDHEDVDMMIQWEVGQGGPDPMSAPPSLGFLGFRWCLKGKFYAISEAIDDRDCAGGRLSPGAIRECLGLQ